MPLPCLAPGDTWLWASIQLCRRPRLSVSLSLFVSQLLPLEGLYAPRSLQLFSHMNLSRDEFLGLPVAR